MPSNLRNLVLIAVIFAAGLLVYFGIYIFGVGHGNRECLKNATTQPDLRNNSLATESPALRKESGIADRDGFTTHSIVFENSERPLESLKTEESIAEVVPGVSSIRRRSKRRTRRRLNAPKVKSPAWQFRLNVTRFDNQTTGSLPKADVTGVELHSGKPRQHLGVSLHVEGSDPKDSHGAWNSVESFLKNLFGGNVEELSEKGHGISIDFNGLPSKIRTGGHKSRSQPRDKEGKFLFGFFGLGVNSENPPIEQGSGDALDQTNSTDPTSSFELSNNIPITGSPLEMNSSVDEIEHTTQMSEILKDSTDIQQLETMITLKKFEVRDLVLEEESTVEDSNTFSTPLAEFSEDSLPTPSEKQPSEDAEIESRVSRHGNELRGVAESRTPEVSTVMTRNTNVVENSSIEEEYSEFCIILLQRMQKSVRRLDDLRDIEGSGSLEENETSSVPATSQEQTSTVRPRPQNLGFFANFLNRITGGIFRQESSTDGTDFTNSSVELETDNRNARIFNFNNLFASFGSGRSAQLNDFEDIKFDDMDLTGAHDIERDLPTVSECVTFFRHIGNKTNFEEDLSLLDKTTESHSTESVQETIFLSGDRGSILEDTENRKSFDNVNSTKDLISEPTADLAGDNEGITFNTFGFESGLNIGSESSELAEEKEGLVLGNFNGGRGITEDLLNDSNTENRLTSTGAPQDLEIIPGILDFGNAGSHLEESFQFEEDAFNVTTDNNERSFGWFLGLGSGERQIQEFVPTNVDFPTSEISKSENAREMHSQDPTYTDLANYEDVITDTGMQPHKEEPVPFSNGSEGALISATELGKEDRRFIGFLNLGSGDGRELVEPNEKSSNRTQPDCVVCTVENGTYPSIRCTECPSGTPSAIPFETGTDHSPVSGAASNVATSDVESFEDSIPTTAEMGSSLTGRLFLSGNDESTDQINLVHETESTPLPSSTLPARGARRGRLDDEIPFDENAESWFRDIVYNTKGRNKNALEDFPESVTDADVTTNSIDPESTELSLSTAVTTRASIRRRNIKPRLRPCTGASQCDATLNERCIVKGQELFCDCGRHFVRHSETWKCEEPASVKISLQFPEEVFHEDLKDESSDRFNLMRKDSIKTIQLFLSRNPELMAALAKVVITGFEEGSVILESDLVFAKNGRNQSVIDFVRKVHSTLKEALEDEEFVRQAPLNAGGAFMVAVSAVVHRCDTTEFNNCSPDARCIPDGSDFRCQCNEGYLDNSRAGFAGEVCIEICPPNFCGENGFCDLKSKEKHCLCSGWYFGGKCEINGIVVISGFAAFNVLAILLIAGVLCFCRRRRRRRSRYYGGSSRSSVQQEESFGHLSGVPTRLQNNLAMKEFGVASSSKYQMTRSTPTHRPPIIDVTSPSIRSSISYDFDSTFDRSANVENEAVRL